MARNDEITIKEAILQLLERYHLTQKVNEVRLLDAWEGVVGPMIARYTGKPVIKNRVLYVKVDNAALRNELTLARTRLLQSLNEAAGEAVIDEIVFR